MNFFINIEFSIHRKGAKHAKIISFMFAADPPKTLAGRKDGKHKG